MKNVYYVGSGELTFELIERIINENLKLELAPEAKERIQKCRDYLDKKTVESAEPLYGITTGFGSLCSKNISQDEVGILQENLIKSHACSVGEEIRPVIIKLMLLLKAHALSLGHSGVQVITVQRILDFFNNDVMPIVYDRGSLGASGDLAPLATGESMELAWKAFLTKGTPAKLQIACVIASRQGVEHLQKLFPGDEVSLWCGAIDPDMNEHSYIVPGLGDAGDLAFGDKL